MKWGQTIMKKYFNNKLLCVLVIVFISMTLGYLKHINLYGVAILLLINVISFFIGYAGGKFYNKMIKR